MKAVIERHPRLPSNVLFGTAIVLIYLSSRTPDGSARGNALLVTSVALAIAAVMYKAVRLPRTRVNFVIDVAFVLFEVSILAEAVAVRRGFPAILDLLLLVFIVIPLPVFLFMYMRLEDELQRSLLVSSGAIAFAGTLIGSFGYWILQRANHLAPLPAPVVFVGGALAWFVTWIILRLRVA